MLAAVTELVAGGDGDGSDGGSGGGDLVVIKDKERKDQFYQIIKVRVARIPAYSAC